jgi:hypothetical protein
VDKEEKDILQQIAQVINNRNFQFKIKKGINYADIK